MNLPIAGAVAAALILLPGEAPAQRLGAGRPPATVIAPGPKPPARLPVRRPAPPAPAPGGDLFLARPWTYQPRSDRLPRHRFGGLAVFPGILGYVAPGSLAPWPWPEGAEVPDRPAVPDVRVYTRADAQPAAPQPYTPGPRGHARTLYVIPGCYAGDVAPRADQLPAGCDAADLRIVPPR